jgi:hypothetical protein
MKQGNIACKEKYCVEILVGQWQQRKILQWKMLQVRGQDTGVRGNLYIDDWRDRQSWDATTRNV